MNKTIKRIYESILSDSFILKEIKQKDKRFHIVIAHININNDIFNQYKYHYCMHPVNHIYMTEGITKF